MTIPSRVRGFVGAFVIFGLIAIEFCTTSKFLRQLNTIVLVQSAHRQFHQRGNLDTPLVVCPFIDSHMSPRFSIDKERLPRMAGGVKARVQSDLGKPIGLDANPKT